MDQRVADSRAANPTADARSIHITRTLCQLLPAAHWMVVCGPSNCVGSRKTWHRAEVEKKAVGESLACLDQYFTLQWASTSASQLPPPPLRHPLCSVHSIGLLLPHSRLCLIRMCSSRVMHTRTVKYGRTLFIWPLTVYTEKSFTFLGCKLHKWLRLYMRQLCTAHQAKVGRGEEVRRWRTGAQQHDKIEKTAENKSKIVCSVVGDKRIQSERREN